MVSKFNISMDTDLKAEAMEFAKKQSRSFSNLLSIALEEYLYNHKDDPALVRDRTKNNRHTKEA